MSNYVIGLISFAAIFGGVLIGRFVANRLPGHHLSSETQSVVTVSVAVIGTLSALCLGLMPRGLFYTSSRARTKRRKKHASSQPRFLKAITPRRIVTISDHSACTNIDCRSKRLKSHYEKHLEGHS